MTLRIGVLWGAAGFMLAALLFKPLLLAVTGFPSEPWTFVAVAVLSVGVLEEGTRAALLGWHRPCGRGLAGMALGWALAELVVVGMGGLLQLTVLARDPVAMAAARAGLPPMAGDVLQRQVESLSSWTVMAWPLERAAAFALQIGFTAWLAAALASGSRGPAFKAAAIALAILGHAAIDLPAAGFQGGLWPLAPVQVLYAIVGIALAPWAWHWCRNRLRPTRAATSG